MRVIFGPLTQLEIIYRLLSLCRSLLWEWLLNFGLTVMRSYCPLMLFQHLKKEGYFWGSSSYYKIVNDLCFFPHGLVTFRDTTRHNLCSSRSLSLAQHFARTNRTLFSFIPNTISAWNSLPLDVVSAPDISSFKKRLSLQLFVSIHIICTIHLPLGTLYI